MDFQIHIYFTLLLLCAFALAVNAAPPEKIVGGSNGDLGEFSYLVSIRKHGRHFCGGAIISTRHILTAAHCVEGKMNPDNPYGITIVSGTNSLNQGGQSHEVQQAVMHPGFVLDESLAIPNDIAVLTLSSPIQYNRFQNKINLASQDFVNNSRAVIAGWGYLNSHVKKVSPVLKKVNPKVIHCQILNRKQICGIHAPGQDTCQGDSGGPLVSKNEVIGVVSWGSPICGTGQPDVYTNVLHYRDFIESQMNLL